MKHHSAKEIEDFMFAHYKKEDEHFYISDFEIELTWDTPNRIAFKAQAQYEPPPFNSALIFALCEFFDAKHINDVDRWDRGGCETCDWGSEYGFELEILP